MQEIQQTFLVRGFEHIIGEQERLGVLLGSFGKFAGEVSVEVDWSGFERDRFGHKSS
jgi:hypothetical protein